MSETSHVVYLTTENIIAMHDVLIYRHGGADGIRDMGALESAVARPQTGYYDGIVDAAAALMESLIQNHPFVDGNKRIAFGAAQSFLETNGYEISAESMDVYEKIIGLFERQEVNHDNLVVLLESIARAT